MELSRTLATRGYPHRQILRDSGDAPADLEHAVLGRGMQLLGIRSDTAMLLHEMNSIHLYWEAKTVRCMSVHLCFISTHVLISTGAKG